MALEIHSLTDLRHEIVDVSEVDESALEFRVVGRTGDRFRLTAQGDKLVLERIASVNEAPSLAETPVPEPRSAPEPAGTKA
jgi:hypothetical protein